MDAGRRSIAATLTPTTQPSGWLRKGLTPVPLSVVGSLATLVILLATTLGAASSQTIDSAAAVGFTRIGPHRILGTPTPTQSVVVPWALERFAAVDLKLPPFTIAFFDDRSNCDGYAGQCHFGRPAHIEVCVPKDNGGTSARLITLHELAHAWAEGIGPDRQAEFLEVRGLTAWRDPTLCRSMWGSEHAAEIVAWGLMDKQVAVNRIPNAEPPALAEAFEVLVGRPPLAPTDQPLRDSV